VYTVKKRVRAKGMGKREGLGEEMKEAQREKETEMTIWGSGDDYGVATISRLFKVIGLFCKGAL